MTNQKHLMRHSWQILRLEDVCNFTRGLTYSKKDEVPFSSNVVLRANNIDQVKSSLDLSDLKYINDKLQIPLHKIVRKNSIIICTASGSKSHLGKVALIDTDYGYAFGGFMGQLEPKENIDPKYLFYNLTSDEYKEHIGALSAGMNINNLKFDDLKNFEINVPPIAEQSRIVGLLANSLDKIEKAKENIEKNLQNSRELFEATLKNIFKNHRSDWQEVELGKLAKNMDNQRVPITKSIRSNGQYPYYGASGIVDYVDNYIFDGNFLLISEDGANLLARSTPIAFSVSGKIWVNNHAHILKFSDTTTQRYVELFLASIRLDEYITGAAQPKLNQSALNSILVPVPPMNEQRVIVAQLDKLSSEVQKFESIYKQKQALLEGLRKSILHKAFSGEL